MTPDAEKPSSASVGETSSSDSMSPGRLRRLTFLLCTVVALDSTMYSSVTPMLPELKDTAELTGAMTGLLVAGYPLGLLAFAIPSGWVAGRTGAKASVIAGAFLLAATSVVFGVADSASVLISVRVVQGVAAALAWAGALTWLIGASSPSRHGVLIGTIVGSGVAGAIVGPLLGVLSAATDRAYVFPSIAVVAVAVGLWLRPLENPERSGDISLRAVARVVWRPWPAVLIWVVALCAGAFGALAVIAPLRLDDLDGTALLIGAAFIVGAVLEMGAGPVAGRISDLRGRRAPMRAAMFVGFALLGGWSLAASLWPSLVLLALALPVVGMMVAPALAAMTDFGRGQGLSVAGVAGLMNFVWASGEALGALGGGLLVAAGQAALGGAVIAALLLASVPLLRVGDTAAPVPRSSQSSRTGPVS